ncbi:ion channel [Ascidiimonas sp. W6]|uniref:ion channel n=1 Tax=Ascidiimonas meishanensis TaxID=3128903 RepID=UPI0030EF65D9
MATSKKLSDPGFGSGSTENVQRFVTKDGKFNIKHLNRKHSIASTYSYLVHISWARFFLLVLAGYIIVNVLFAILYLSIGINEFYNESNSWFIDFLNAFFFSAQTITTVGYGSMAPKGVLVGIVSTIEALVGLLSFSFITGLLYGRFSKPRSFVKFSDQMVLRPFKKENALMFRIMNTKETPMIKPKVTVTLSLHEMKKGNFTSSFFQLSMERDFINYLPTTWTLVHHIDKDSPLYKYSLKEIPHLKGEIIVMASYFDESFNEEVHRVFSYTLDEIEIDHEFVKAFDFDSDGITVLDHEKLNETRPINS